MVPDVGDTNYNSLSKITKVGNVEVQYPKPGVTLLYRYGIRHI